MDAVTSLAAKVTMREEKGNLPFSEKDQTAVPSSRIGFPQHYPPIRNTAVHYAAVTLAAYFDPHFFGNVSRRGEEAKQEAGRIREPYVNRVVTAWEQGRNMRSIRLLAILGEEYAAHMHFYSPGTFDESVMFEWTCRTAQHLGIETDWPELLPARWQEQLAQPATQPQYSPSNQQPYSSDPYFAARVGRMHNTANWVQANPGGWAGPGWRMDKDGNIHMNPHL